MDEHYFEPQIDPAVLRLTRFKSRRLAGNYGFARHDAEDIQQELLVDSLQRSKSFDAHRCTGRTFAQLVVNNRIATIIEGQQAACRDYRACRISLDQPRDHLGRNPSEVGDALAGIAAPFGGRLFEESLNLRLDVQLVLGRLPAALAYLCRLLMDCDTCAEAAARAEISRATLYRQIAKIRAVFVKEGLRARSGER
ncbi:MAG: hypothetical protein M3N41_00855 [Acidobacteriota bacterium]|nr:hypothetical protein [Acidobacteriota bacterium]